MASPVYSTTDFVLAGQSSIFPEGVVLDVPLHIVRNITPRPVKWLRYASWAILHLEGTIFQNGHRLHDDDTIEDGVKCLFISDSDLAHAVPVNYAINARRTASSSSIVAGESGFEARLQDRDVGCAFTHRELRYCDAVHIVPHARHPDWIDRLSQSRYPTGFTAEREDLRVGALEIDSPTNGFMIYAPYRRDLDAHRAIIIKTPNHILDTSDIAPPAGPLIVNNTYSSVDYPENTRYTWHWLEQPETVTTETELPNNTRAMFNLASEEPHPSGFLLDIVFAATILHAWGVDGAGDTLKTHPGCPKTPPPLKRTLRHPLQSNDHETGTTNRSNTPEVAAGSACAGEDEQASGTDDKLDETAPSDPWDILLRASFLRPGVREMFEEQHKEFENGIRTWRNAISDSEADGDNRITQELDAPPMLGLPVSHSPDTNGDAQHEETGVGDRHRAGMDNKGRTDIPTSRKEDKYQSSQSRSGASSR